MLSAVEKLKEIVGDGENVDALSAVIAVELESGGGTLLQLVEALGFLLTDTDKERRVRGTRLLSHVLQLLRKDFLSESECNVLSAFYCDRLNDHYTVVPAALTGISALCLMDNLPDGSPPDILIALQQNVMCQTLTVSHRHTFYSIFHNIFLKKKSKVLSGYASDFLFGLVTGMSSEHDPRNLLYLFTILPSILSDIPLKNLKLEAFAVLESYFPVDYSPINESDPISRNDLARGLEACFASTAEFGELCFPMICEKLESSLGVAQTDALKLLERGMRKWSLEELSSQIEEVWTGLRGVLVGTQTSPDARDALVAMLNAYSRAPLGDRETKAWTYLLHSLSSYTHSYLSEPGLSLFTPTVKLLACVASVSSATSDFIIPRVVPQLIALLESDCSFSDKVTVLKAIGPFLVLSIKFDSWKSEVCRSHLEKVLPIIMKLLMYQETCGASYLCLTYIHSKTDQDLRCTLYKQILTTLPKEPSKSTRDEIGYFLECMAEFYPEEVENSILSTFSIPGELDFESEKSRRLVELLIRIMEAKTLKLQTAKLFLKFIIEDEDVYARWRAVSIFTLRDHCLEKGSIFGPEVGREFPLALLRRYLRRPCDEETEAAATIINILIRSLPILEQISIMSDGLDILSSYKNSPEIPVTKLVLTEGLLSGLESKVEIPDLFDLSECLLRVTVSAEAETTRTCAARLLALFINKSSNDEIVSKVIEKASTIIKTNTCNVSVVLCAWITKALVFRAHPLAGVWLEQLLSFTADDSVGMEAAYGVRLLLEDSPILSVKNFCTISFLYKQRVFEKVELLIPTSGKPSKAASLALAFILKYSPAILILGRLEKLATVMVHCLDDGDEIISKAILEILSTLLNDTVPELIGYVEEFIPRLLNLASTSPFMEVRSIAIDCIFFYANYKIEDIQPYKKMVVTKLQKCLDDKKRMVRQSAVRARTKWFVL